MRNPKSVPRSPRTSRVPRRLLTRIERDVPIALLARRAGVDLRRAGDALLGHCLLHEEGGAPTLLLKPALNRWHCARCRAGGSPVAWVTHHSNLDEKDAALELLREFFPGETRAPRARRRADRLSPDRSTSK